MCKSMTRWIIGTCLLLAPAGVWAQGEGAGIGGVAGLKAGGAVHAVFSELDSGLVVEVEGGVHLLRKRLDLMVGLGWAQPPAHGAADDSRFEAGDFAWELNQTFLMFSLVARYRFLALSSPFNAYAGLGPRLFWLRTVVNGHSGEELLGENRQTETRVGGVLLLGGEYSVGPGAALGELSLGIGGLNGLLTGEASSSALSGLIGYRYRF